MKKNFKFMLVALLAMVSTGAFATHNLTRGSEQTIGGISYKVVTVYNTTTSAKINTVTAEKNNFTGTEIKIPATVDIAVEGTDEDNVAINKVATFNVIQVKDFSGLSNVTSITVGANVETIDAGAFIGTKIASLDLSGTKVATIDRWFTSTAAGKTTNAYLQSVSLPVTATTIVANAFDGCSALSSVTFAALSTATGAVNVTTINADAFKGTAIVNLDLSNTKISDLEALFGTAGITALTSVSLPVTLATIKANAFKGCSNLAEVNFAALSTATGAVNVTAINAGAFSGTKIATLDLTNTKITALNQLFEEMNTTLEKVILPATLTSIESNAFKSLGKLSSVDFTACNATAGLTIKATAFDTAVLLKEIELPANLKELEANALKDSYLTSMTIKSAVPTSGAIIKTINATGATRLTTLVIDGDLPAGSTFATSAFTSLETLTFKGKVPAGTIQTGAFASCTPLATVTFEKALAAGAVATGAFANNGSTIVVNYGPAIADENTGSFAQDAFAATGAAVYVTFNTTEHYKAAIEAALTPDTPGNYLFGVALSASVTPESDGTITVANNGSGSYYYAAFIPTADVKIAKTQGDANVMVYGAYVDNAATPVVMMEQLHLYNGYYYIPANSKVIVKSSSSDAVEFDNDPDGTLNSNNYDSSNNDQNEIQAHIGANTFAATIKATAAAGKQMLFLAPIAEYGYRWTGFRDERIVSAGQFYLEANETTASSIRIVWLDGSEEDTVTAIESVKTGTSNTDTDGVIYNVAGQKVNAGYKGIVIKNGKKFIQK